MVDITFLASKMHTHQAERFIACMPAIEKEGDRAFLRYSDQAETEIVACWGWRRGKILYDAGHKVLVFERGYIGDRFSWCSIGLNGLNGYADFFLPEEMDCSRFSNNFSMHEWNDEGQIIVIMGQIKGDMSLKDRDLTSFYEEKAIELQKYYNKKVYFRPHPALPDRNFKPRLPIINGTLQEILAKCFLVVTYNSNSAVDAVLYGIPALSFDQGSMAWNVTGHKIEDRIMPDRKKWATALSYCQYSPDELLSGEYWRRFKCRLVN